MTKSVSCVPKLALADCNCQWLNLPAKPLSLRRSLLTASAMAVADSDDVREGLDEQESEAGDAVA